VVTVSGVPVLGGDGEFLGYRGTGRDITLEVEAAERLREGETRFRSLFENMRDIIFCRGVRGDAAHGYDPAAPSSSAPTRRASPARSTRWEERGSGSGTTPCTPTTAAATWRPSGGGRRTWSRSRWSTASPTRTPARSAGCARWPGWCGTRPAGRTYFDSYIIDVTEQRRREATLAEALARLESQAGEMRALAEAAGRASRAKSEFLAR
jgi:PAS domain-containing protein